MLKNRAIDQLRLYGGVLCLDFVNTVPDRVDGSNDDLLLSFDDLIYWARKAKSIDAGAFSALEKAGRNERKAKEFLGEALALRSLIYAIFKSISNKKKADPREMSMFNRIARRYFSYLEIIPGKETFTERWNLAPGHFNSITAPIVKSAYDLLLSGRLEKVKECPNCGWLFLDTSKNGKRRWCSMEDCGSNVKALEYYYRKKRAK